MFRRLRTVSMMICRRHGYNAPSCRVSRTTQIHSLRTYPSGRRSPPLSSFSGVPYARRARPRLPDSGILSGLSDTPLRRYHVSMEVVADGVGWSDTGDYDGLIPHSCVYHRLLFLAPLEYPFLTVHLPHIAHPAQSRKIYPLEAHLNALKSFSPHWRPNARCTRLVDGILNLAVSSGGVFTGFRCSPDSPLRFIGVGLMFRVARGRLRCLRCNSLYQLSSECQRVFNLGLRTSYVVWRCAMEKRDEPVVRPRASGLRNARGGNAVLCVRVLSGGPGSRFTALGLPSASYLGHPVQGLDYPIWRRFDSLDADVAPCVLLSCLLQGFALGFECTGCGAYGRLGHCALVTFCQSAIAFLEFLRSAVASQLTGGSWYSALGCECRPLYDPRRE